MFGNSRILNLDFKILYIMPFDTIGNLTHTHKYPPQTQPPRHSQGHEPHRPEGVFFRGVAGWSLGVIQMGPQSWMSLVRCDVLPDVILTYRRNGVLTLLHRILTKTILSGIISIVCYIGY